MKRERKYPDTDVFIFHNANPKNRMTGDCVYRAVATVTGQPWETVARDLAELAIKTGYAPSTKECYGRYLESKGFKKEKQPRKRDNTKYTGVEFCRTIQRHLSITKFGKTSVNDIVISPCIFAHIGGGHVVAIIDGKVNDTWDSTDGCIGNYWYI